MKQFVIVSLFSLLSLYLFGLLYLVIRFNGQLYYTNENGITFVRVYDWLHTFENLASTGYVFSIDDLKNSISWFSEQLTLLFEGDFINFISTNLGFGSVDLSSVFSGDFWNILSNLVNFLTFPLKLICTVLLSIGAMFTVLGRLLYMVLQWLVTFVLVFFNPVIVDLPLII